MSLKNLGNISNAIKFIDNALDSGKDFDDIALSLKGVFDKIDAKKVVKSMFSLGLSVDEIRDKIKFFPVDTDKAEDAIKLLGTSGVKSFKDIGSAITGFFLSPLGKVAIAATAVTAVIAGIQAYNAHVQELVDNAREAGSAWVQTNNELKSQTERVHELKTALEDENLTEEESYRIKSELLSIQESLISTYGKEADGIDLVS